MSAKLRIVLTASSALVGVFGPTAAALADEQIERVTVTAQKRLEDVQKVPIFV